LHTLKNEKEKEALATTSDSSSEFEDLQTGMNQKATSSSGSLGQNCGKM